MNNKRMGEDSIYSGCFEQAASPHGPYQVVEDSPHHFSTEHTHPGSVHAPVVSRADSRDSLVVLPTAKNGCRLFGFSLTKDSPVENKVNAPVLASQFSTKDLNLEATFWGTGWETIERHSHSVPQGLTKSLVRGCTKVHKQGSVVGRAVDLSKLDGYDDLITELEWLFNMEGLLNDPEKGWHVLYKDDTDDMMLVGDDPWQKFCNIVSKILIYAHDEVV